MHLFWRSLSEPGFLGLIDCQDFNTFVIRQMAANLEETLRILNIN